MATPPRTQRGRRRSTSAVSANNGRSAPPGLDTDVVYDPISAAAGMKDYLAAHPAGLVAVTSHVRDRLAHTVFGSGAAEIVHAVLTAPVLGRPGHEKRRCRRTQAGLLLLRVVVGVALVGHGTQKLFGWFGGHGPRTTGTFFEMLGYRPGVLFAVIAGLSEAGGGALLALGFLTPLAGAAVIGVMLNAASSLRGRGPWMINGGWEYTVVLATVGASIALTGPGAISVDHALGLELVDSVGRRRHRARRRRRASRRFSYDGRLPHSPPCRLTTAQSAEAA